MVAMARPRAPERGATVLTWRHPRRESTQMAEFNQAPSPETLRDFVDRLAAFRKTLPPEQQLLLDTLLLAALDSNWHDEVEPYWVEVPGGHPRSRRQGQQGPAPSRESLQAFGEQLAEFRELLPEEQQQLLDKMTAAAG
jgi:hypothetical protein